MNSIFQFKYPKISRIFVIFLLCSYLSIVHFFASQIFLTFAFKVFWVSLICKCNLKLASAMACLQLPLLVKKHNMMTNKDTNAALFCTQTLR